MTNAKTSVSSYVTQARDGFKFVGAATDYDVGELFEGLEAAKNENGCLFINCSEDEDEPDWVEVFVIYEMPITVALTPIDEDDVKLHPDWRL